MSKIVTQRFEYVNYDDSTQVVGSSGVITAYPVATDQYSNNSTATAGSSYGTANITSASGSPATANLPVGATVTMVGASSNTVLAGVSVSNVALAPGGTVVPTLTFPVAPGQVVTLPGVFNTGTLSIAAVSSNLQTAASAVAVQLLWSV